MEDEVLGRLESFFGEFKPMVYRKGETILRAEETPPGIYYVKSGFVRGYALSERGNELTLNVFKPGSYFPITWGLAEMPNTGYFEAMTEATLWRAPRDKVIEFLKNDPEVAWELMRRIAIGLGGIAGRMVSLLFGSAGGRVATVLWISGRRFGKKKENGQVEVQLHLTHQEIANQAGLTRETTSVEMKKLEKRRLISYKGRVLVVNDMEKLAKETQVEEEEALPNVF